MNEYQIETGVPLPKAKRGRPTVWQDLVDKMKEGDSVLVDDARQADHLRFAMRRAGHLSARRKVREGIRVWKMGTNEKAGN